VAFPERPQIGLAFHVPKVLFVKQYRFKGFSIYFSHSRSVTGLLLASDVTFSSQISSCEEESTPHRAVASPTMQEIPTYGKESIAVGLQAVESAIDQLDGVGTKGHQPVRSVLAPDREANAMTNLFVGGHLGPREALR
jgi:hypothetical protein